MEAATRCNGEKISNEGLFSLTQSAAERVNFLKSQENNPNLRFRVMVRGGGCSGFQYGFTLDNKEPDASDIVVENYGAQAVIDDVSINMLKGAVLDYIDDMSNAGFLIKNPNATARCGCGNSFSA